MTINELIHHLEQIRAVHGNIEVRVDSDLFSDHIPRGITSAGIIDYFVRPVQTIILGKFPSEANETKVVLYVGNEPKYTVY